MNNTTRWIPIRGKKIPGIICRYNPVTHEIEVKKGRVTERVKLPIDKPFKTVYNENSKQTGDE